MVVSKGEKGLKTDEVMGVGLYVGVCVRNLLWDEEAAGRPAPGLYFLGLHLATG